MHLGTGADKHYKKGLQTQHVHVHAGGGGGVHGCCSSTDKKKRSSHQNYFILAHFTIAFGVHKHIQRDAAAPTNAPAPRGLGPSNSSPFDFL